MLQNNTVLNKLYLILRKIYAISCLRLCLYTRRFFQAQFLGDHIHSGQESLSQKQSHLDLNIDYSISQRYINRGLSPQTT